MKNTDTKTMLINGNLQELTFEDFKQKFIPSLINFLKGDKEKYDFDYLGAVLVEVFTKYDDPTIETFNFFMLVAITHLYHYTLDEVKQMDEEQLKRLKQEAIQ